VNSLRLDWRNNLNENYSDGCSKSFYNVQHFLRFSFIIYTSQEQFSIAAWIIILAAVFDSLDGIMARMTRSSSQFGVELDSLADVVSFGVAPSFMAYQVYLRTIEPWGILIAALACRTWRNSISAIQCTTCRFRQRIFQRTADSNAAITMCAFILQFGYEKIIAGSLASIELIVLVVVLSFLMVSHVKYDTMPKLSKLQLKSHPYKLLSFLLPYSF